MSSLPARTSIVAAITLAATAASPTPDGPRIVIDGAWDDWRDIPPSLTDPIDAVPGATVDFGAVRVAHDRQAVYLAVDVAQEINLNGLDGVCKLLLDTDGKADTGWEEHGVEGVDLVLEMSPRAAEAPEAPGFGVGLRAVPEERALDRPYGRLSSYAAGVLIAPSYADLRYELRIERGLGLTDSGNATFADTAFRGALVALARDGTLEDRTATFRHALDPVGEEPAEPADGDSGAARPAAASRSAAARSGDPLRRPSSTFRLVVWNVARDSLRRQPTPFRRIVGALAPDLLVFDELGTTVTRDVVTAFLESLPPRAQPRARQLADWGETWRTALGSGGGAERSLVASHYAVRSVPGLERIDLDPRARSTLLDSMRPAIREEMESEIDPELSSFGALVEVGDRRLLVVPVDFRCCGLTLDGPEERSRLLQARTLWRALRRALLQIEVDGVIIGGDFNLVGTRRPLDLVARGLDPAGGDLSVVDALQLDGTTNATWSQPGNVFPPGRLDFVLYSASALGVERAFAFDTADLDAEWLGRYGLGAADRVDASDHLPLVVDFTLR